MEEQKAVITFGRRMISNVLKKRQPFTPDTGARKKPEKHKESREGRGDVSQSRPKERKDGGKLVGDWPSDHKPHNLHLSEAPKRERDEREREQTSHNPVSQGPAVQLVPPQLISLLKHKAFMEEMRRSLEVELHDPSLCKMCMQKRASLALNNFIRRKKTQLDALTLDDRLHKHLHNRDSLCLLGELAQSLPNPTDAPDRIWEELLGRDMQVTAT